MDTNHMKSEKSKLILDIQCLYNFYNVFLDGFIRSLNFRI